MNRVTKLERTIKEIQYSLVDKLKINIEPLSFHLANCRQE